MQWLADKVVQSRLFDLDFPFLLSQHDHDAAGGGEATFRPRPIEGAPSSSANVVSESLLLDGQQRLCSNAVTSTYSTVGRHNKDGLKSERLLSCEPKLIAIPDGRAWTLLAAHRFDDLDLPLLRENPHPPSNVQIGSRSSVPDRIEKFIGAYWSTTCQCKYLSRKFL